MKLMLAFLSLVSIAAGAAEKNSKMTVSVAESKVNWLGKKITGEHNGTVNLKSGIIELKGKSLVGGELVMDMVSIKNLDLTDAEYNKKLTTHLNSDDFFGTAKFPEAKLKITGAKELAPGKAEVEGDLTIKGKTHPIKFPVELSITEKMATASGKLVIDRTKYDIKYNSGKFFKNLGDKMINDEFELSFEVKAN